jgi:hypothetical protein
VPPSKSLLLAYVLLILELCLGLSELPADPAPNWTEADPVIDEVVAKAIKD